MELNLENIPRTIRLIRAASDMAPIPEGYPVLVLLDQTKLPYAEEYVYITDWRQVIDAIKRLVVRGAPAIGIAGAAALVLRAAEFCYGSSSAPQDEFDMDRVFLIDREAQDMELYFTSMDFAADMVVASRPTAVNLECMVRRAMRLVRECIDEGKGPSDIEKTLFGFTEHLIEEDELQNRRIGRNGAALLPDSATVLTHCNAGSLATAFYGTALGVVYAAASDRGIERVYADETRPVGQGSRLTVWELSRAGVPVTLICDDMAASVIASGEVDAVVVGADRIAANGDVANKIGTLGLALAASHYGVPFYVVAPTSTLDSQTPDGASIKIEQRSSEEVLPQPIEGVDVYNPAFDVTPASLITAIVTEAGVFNPSDVLSSLN